MNFEVIKSKTEICYLIYSRKVRFDFGFFLLSMREYERIKGKVIHTNATCISTICRGREEEGVGIETKFFNVNITRPNFIMSRVAIIQMIAERWK